MLLRALLGSGGVLDVRRLMAGSQLRQTCPVHFPRDLLREPSAPFGGGPIREVFAFVVASGSFVPDFPVETHSLTRLWILEDLQGLWHTGGSGDTGVVAAQETEGRQQQGEAVPEGAR